MNLTRELKDLGLLESEIRIYLFLLSEGLCSPSIIAAGTKVARPHCYGILESLKQKGIIEEQKKGKRKAFLASDPDALMRSLDRKKEKLAQLLPDLRGLHMVQKNKPLITFYDGVEQVKEVFLQTLKAKEIWGIGSTKEFSKVMPGFFLTYQEKVRSKEIVFHDLLTAASKESAEKIQKIICGFYEVHFLPAKYGEVPTNILIWNNNVAIIDFSVPIFGTILANEALVKTFKIIFDAIKEKS